MARHIVAMGGGGFLAEPDNPLLDAYVVALTGKERPRVCFLPTASGDAASDIYRFHRHFRELTGRSTSHLGLKPPSKPDLAAHLLAQDVIYVGGGDAAAMLRIWRETGVDQILKEAYARGVVLAGVSAGALCWFEWGLTDARAGVATPLAGLGFLPGSAAPHYDGAADQRPAFQRLVAAGGLPRGVGLSNGSALHFVDERLHRVVSARPEARVFEVSAEGGVVREVERLAEYLGGQGTLIRRAVAADAAAICAAHHRSIRELAASDYSAEQIEAWTLRPTAEAVPALTAQILGDSLWVVEIDGCVEGYVHLRTPLAIAPAAYLHALYVTLAASRRGLGKRLVGLAEHEALRLGNQEMQLHASKTALGFYVNIGYRRSGPPLLHLVNGVGLECFPMTKALRP